MKKKKIYIYIYEKTIVRIWYKRKRKKKHKPSTTEEWTNELWYSPKMECCGIIKGINYNHMYFILKKVHIHNIEPKEQVVEGYPV